jgi:hypothetical protein
MLLPRSVAVSGALGSIFSLSADKGLGAAGYMRDACSPGFLTGLSPRFHSWLHLFHSSSGRWDHDLQ